MTKYIHTLFFVFHLISLAHSKQTHYPLLDSAVTLSNNQQYSKAITLLESYSVKNPPSTLHQMTIQTFIAIVYINRFDDLGDSTDVLVADSILSPCEHYFNQIEESNHSLFWLNLIRLQRAYVNELQGKSVSAALQIRSASNNLARLTQNTDAQAFSAIYHYYIELSLSWVPFSNAKEYIQPLAKGAHASRWFKKYFIHTLSWIYLEEKRYGDAIALIKKLLISFPDDRISHQILADFYYTQGDIQKAIDIYKNSLTEYSAIAPGSVRYLCALANLALFHTQINENTQAATYLKQLKKSQYKPMLKWLPPTLIESLQRRNLL
ncbi:MAG: hypothetical protein OCC49_07655 [Fibrobacterales bacterium]